MIRLFFILLFIVINSTFELSALEKNQLTIINKHNLTHGFVVEVARTNEEKKRGLMFRKTLDANSGMLFLYQREALQLMWMKNTLIPLDILFIDKTGIITRIVERAVPHSLATISSRGKVLAVLELKGGLTSRLDIKRGDKVNHPAFN